MINTGKNKKEFEDIVKKNIKREGIEKVLAWLDATDFYTAPASTRYHLSVEGGLCQHSLNVYHRLVGLSQFHSDLATADEHTVFGGTDIEQEGTYSLENITIVALFHDICKANCYVNDLRNVKVDGKWKQVDYWKWEEDFVYGHGAKSVYILQQFIRLYVAEAQAIRYHMAGKEDPLSNTYERGYAQVFEKSNLAVLLHLADMMASFMDETRE